MTTEGEILSGIHANVVIGLDTYAEMDVVSLAYVQQLGLKPCTRKKHNHAIPTVEGAGMTVIPTYGVYHLHLVITDRWGTKMPFVRPFAAITRNPTDAPILLGCPALQDMSIVIDAAEGTREFKRVAKVEAISVKAFRRHAMKMTGVRIMAIQAGYYPPDEQDDPWTTKTFPQTFPRSRRTSERSSRTSSAPKMTIYCHVTKRQIMQ